jgi:protein-L-isoaspartate(D-aspartate) O-methyltransferase
MKPQDFAAARKALIAEVVAETADTAAWTGRRKLSAPVLAALEAVAREDFVPVAARDAAYVNAPLPIGHGQTISQPYIVAIMTELLDLDTDSVVLEIGTGCGYQAAILACIARRVYSIEYVPELAASATERLAALGYDNVEVRQGDGRAGWPEHAPFDAIIATAAGDAVPPALLDQLAPGGRLVAPVGTSHWSQKLIRVTRDEAGNLHRDDLLPVAFVPLVGDGKG